MDMLTDYTAEFQQGGVKAAIAATGAKSGDLLMVPIDKIRVPEGLNVRDRTEAYERHIEMLCDSIIENGFFRWMPLRGYAAKVGDETVIYVTGGFSRLEAAKLAIKRASIPLEVLPVVLTPSGTSMADIQLGLAMDNTGRALTPYERGRVVKRLIGYGWSQQDIATKLVVSQAYVNNLLYLHGLPQAIQDMVMRDQVSANHAVTTAKAVGPDEALKTFQDALLVTNNERIEGDPSSEDDDIEKGGSAGRIRPKATGVVSKKIILAAVDYAIALGDIEFLIRWRKGEKDAVDELAATLKKPKAVKAKAVKAKRKTKAQKTADAVAAAEIGKAADELEDDDL
jgi:ParB-like chromosome segregation protein Spo0J